jgi:hypothetical protein
MFFCHEGNVKDNLFESFDHFLMVVATTNSKNGYGGSRTIQNDIAKKNRNTVYKLNYILIV